jgi:hypothetical protein
LDDGLWANFEVGEEGIPQGLKAPSFLWRLRDPRLKPWATQKQRQRQQQNPPLGCGMTNKRTGNDKGNPNKAQATTNEMAKATHAFR